MFLVDNFGDILEQNDVVLRNDSVHALLSEEDIDDGELLVELHDRIRDHKHHPYRYQAHDRLRLHVGDRNLRPER